MPEKLNLTQPVTKADLEARTADREHMIACALARFQTELTATAPHIAEILENSDDDSI